MAKTMDLFQREILVLGRANLTSFVEVLDRNALLGISGVSVRI